jgi:prepilin peptidase CpaA
LDSVIPVLGASCLAFAAYTDVRSRRIPNALAVAVATLGVIRLILDGDPGAALDSVAVAAAIFAVGFLLFWRGLIGGGDVKLMAATGLLVGYHALSEFLVAMSLFGLVATLAVLAADRLGAVPVAATHDPTRVRPTVPYGVAIAASGILTLVLQSVVSG